MRTAHQRIIVATLAAIALALDPVALGQSPVVVKPNVRVNAPLGPDGVSATWDDNDPADPITRAQWEPLIAASRTTPGLLFIGAADESYGSAQSVYGLLRHPNIGFMSTGDRGATWRHDISRLNGGYPGDLPVPVGCDAAWAGGNESVGVAFGGNGVMYLVARERNLDPTSPMRRSLYFAHQPESAIDNPQWVGDTLDAACDYAPVFQWRPRIAADWSTASGRSDRVFVAWER